MLIGLTGTPGTGKTSVSNLLEKRRGYRAIHLNELIKEERLYSEVDEERDTLVADMDRVSARVFELVDDSYDVTILDSHLSHHIADIVIVLRTAPDKLRERLSFRNYSKAKVSENVDAEALDVILIESVEWCEKVFEIDTTEATVEDIAKDVDEIVRALLSGDDNDMLLKYKPGAFDWSDEIF